MLLKKIRISHFFAFNFQDGVFPDEHVPTVFETTLKQMQVEDNTIEFTLWDTAGQEDYDKLRPLSYANKHVVLICFSVDRQVFFAMPNFAIYLR